MNKQYTKDNYEALVSKIIEQMRQTGDWGEFFPASLAPFPYNLTHAQDYYPLSKAEALKRGYAWRDEDQREYQPSTYAIPESIAQVSDEILKQTLACKQTGKNFRMQKSELQFYRKLNLPIPLFCPDVRHAHRLQKRNPRKLYQRTCTASGKPLLTTIGPDRPEKVVSDEEFAKLLE